MIGEKQVTAGQFGKAPLDCSIWDGGNLDCICRSGGLNFPLATSVMSTAAVFGSYHTGMVQFAFGDGSVHAIRNSIAPQILDNLCNIADGNEVPSVDDLQ